MTASTTAPAKAAGTIQAVPEAIPFRKSGVTSAPEVLGLLVTTLLVLAVAGAVLWYARKRGWLDRWAGAAVRDHAQAKRLAVLETLRLSRQTTIHRVADGDRVYLIAESTAQVQMTQASSIGGEMP